MRKPSSHPGFDESVNHGKQHPGFEKSLARENGAIHIKPSHRGELHRDLDVPEGQPIPEGKLKAAEHSANPAIRKRAQFADNAEKFQH
jgi:hypothetical protein